jgi:hypothetical protein
MQDVEHDDAGEVSVPEGETMRVGDDVNARKLEDIDRDHIPVGFLDVGGPAADVENSTLRAALQQLPMVVAVKLAQRALLAPQVAMDNLPLVQTAHGF